MGTLGEYIAEDVKKCGKCGSVNIRAEKVNTIIIQRQIEYEDDDEYISIVSEYSDDEDYNDIYCLDCGEQLM